MTPASAPSDRSHDGRRTAQRLLHDALAGHDSVWLRRVLQAPGVVALLPNALQHLEHERTDRPDTWALLVAAAARGATGPRALARAIDEGRPDIVSDLLAAGVTPHPPCNSPWSAPHRTVPGSEPGPPNPTGRTDLAPLVNAITCVHRARVVDLVRVLLAGGADPTRRDRDGATVLSWLVLHQRDDDAAAGAAAVLIAAGAPTDVPAVSLGFVDERPDGCPPTVADLADAFWVPQMAGAMRAAMDRRLLSAHQDQDAGGAMGAARPKRAL